MIDIGKVKAAFASTAAFCQGTFYKKDDGDKPASLCALSSLVSAAGVHPDLIGKFNTNKTALTVFFGPVLEVEYGVPPHLMHRVAESFDNEANEFRAISAVLTLFEKFNANEEKRAKEMQELYSTPFTFTMFPAQSWVSKNVYLTIDKLVFDMVEPPTLEYVNISKVIEGDLLNSLGYKIPKDEKKLITGLIAPQIIEQAPADMDFATYAKQESKQLIGDVKEWIVTV